MSRHGRKFGCVADEIIYINPDLISLRLMDGTNIGTTCVISKTQNVKGIVSERYTVEDPASVLCYNPAQLEQIKNAWNARKADYGDLDGLKRKIKARGAVEVPLSLFIDGQYIVLAKGHRRHRATQELRAEGVEIETIPAIIKVLGNGFSLEDLEIDQWTGNEQEPLSYLAKADLIKRALKRGLTKTEFCEQAGIEDAEYETVLFIAGQPREIIQRVDEGLIAPTTLKKAVCEARHQKMSQVEFEQALTSAVTWAEDNGKKPTGDLVVRFIRDFESQNQTSGVAVMDKEVETIVLTEEKAEVLPPISTSTTIRKPRKFSIKPKASEMAEMFKKIMEASASIQKGESVGITIPKQLWDQASEIYQRLD